MTRFRGIQTGSDMFSLHEKSIEITFTYSPLKRDRFEFLLFTLDIMYL